MTKRDEIERVRDAGERLPVPVGRMGPWGWALVAVLLALVVVGYVAHHAQEERGLIVTGMRTPGIGGAAWGLHIAMDAYLVGLSFAGIGLAALVRLMNLTALRPLTRIAELLTITALMVSGMIVISDLGRPLAGLMALPRYARPQSPFFGTFTLVVSGSLFATLVYFYLAGRADAARAAKAGPRPLRWAYRLWASGYRGTPEEQARRSRVNFWLALFILPLLLLAHSTLGFIFGIQGGRPGWFSALQAPGFVVLSACSGIGALIVVSAAVRRAFGLQDVITDTAFMLLGNVLWVLTAVYVYFVAVEQLTATYAARKAESALALEVLRGTFSTSFWVSMAFMLATIAIGLWQFLRRRALVGACVVAGILINVAALVRRLLIVVPSQTHGQLLHYPTGSYVPTVPEVLAVVGTCALGALGFVAFIHLFPVVPLRAGFASARGGAPEPRGRRLVRNAAFGVTLGLGVLMTVAGLLLSARVDTVHYADPTVPYSPVIFIVGVVLVFYSAAVYETVPPARPVERAGSA